jgi:peptidoglycan/LPS O-acetylase OafA/YrhL
MNNLTTGHPQHLRIKTLDALRGLAALSVVLGHVTGGLYIAELIDHTPLFMLRAGHEAVIFFFMLSGYVLVYQYGGTAKFIYGKFLALRFFRLYIPYICSVGLGLILLLLSVPGNPNYVFVSQLWGSKVNLGVILGHVLLIGNFNTGAINSVIWSLVQEMRFAILFPLALYLLTLRPAKLLIILSAVTIMAAGGIVLCTITKNDSYNGYLSTPYFFYMFLAGGYIAKYRQGLLGKYNRFTKTTKLLLTIAAILVYSYAHTVTLTIARQVYIPGLVRSRFFIEDLLIAAASFYVIIWGININGTKNILETRIPLFLGKISYNLYLVHLPIITFMYFALRYSWPLAAILVSGLFVSFLVAIIFNKFIETGAMRWGKAVVKRYFSPDKS